MFAQLAPRIQKVLRKLEELNETYEQLLPATLSPRLKKRGVMKKVRLWSVPRETGELLFQIVLEKKPQYIVELGTSAGYSTVWLAAACAQYGGHVYTIDSSQEKHALAKRFIEDAGLSSFVTFITESLAVVCENPKTFIDIPQIDMVFFDADKKNTLRFYFSLQPYMSANHVLIADDCVKYEASMQSFIHEIKARGYVATLYDIGHGVLVASTPAHAKRK